MPKTLLISRKNPEFKGLMTELVKGIRSDDALHINHVKKLLEEANIHVGYNKESDKLEVLQEGARPVVFDAKEFESVPAQPAQPQPAAKA